jgi:hypothetical protein
MKFKFKRTIGKKFPISEYQIKNLDKPFYNCHWGQRKLLWTEIEFLTKVSKKIPLSECWILYIGSANGIHINILFDLFPDAKFILYDPNRFLVKQNDRVIIKTGKDGFFDDTKIEEVLKIAKNQKIIFISDIRINPDESEIWRDNLSQQRWAIKLDSEFMMFKFRLPYVYEITEKIDFSYSVEDIKDKIIMPKSEENMKHKIIYLKGKIYSQLYAPQRSTETRLICGKRKYYGKSKDGDKYDMDIYDYKKYEGQMNYFNIYYRNGIFKYKNSEIIISNIIGYDKSYESVAEYYLALKFLKLTKKNPTDLDIVELLIKINNFITDNSSINLIICSMSEIIKYRLVNNITVTDKFKMKKFIDFIVNFKNNMTSNLKKQIKLIKDKKIISKSNLKNQIQELSKRQRKNNYMHIDNDFNIVYSEKLEQLINDFLQKDK